MNDLDAKVKAVNRANAEANTLVLKLQEVFKPFVGQKITKVDGELFAKIKLPVLPYMTETSVYRRQSDYSLSFTVKTCELIPPNTCTYYEATVYIGEMSNGVLTNLVVHDPLRTDYTVDELLSKRETCKQARNAYENVKSALYPFGE